MSKKQKFFVVAQYVMRPRNKNKTHDSKYMSDPANFQYDELFNIVTKIKDRELSTYGVILDLTEKKVVKNSSQSGKTYDETLKYFVDNYSKDFTRLLGEYIGEVKDLLPAVVTDAPMLVESKADFQPV